MIVNITPENFQTEVIENSLQKTIILLFYADTIPESTPVKQALERTIGVNNSHITLANVDATNPSLQTLAIQLGLQTLPAMVSFKDKRPVDIRVGPQTPQEIEEFIKQYQPNPCDLAIETAQKLLKEGYVEKAYMTLQSAHKDSPHHIELRLHLAQVCLQLKKIQQAETLLQQIPLAEQHSFFHSLIAELELAKQAAQSPELKALEEKFAQDPDNQSLKQELAVLYSQNGLKEQALDLLLSILKKDMEFGEAKKFYLDIIATMAEDPAAIPYKRAYYSLLY